jgi:hypothetical protein
MGAAVRGRERNDNDGRRRVEMAELFSRGDIVKCALRMRGGK